MNKNAFDFIRNSLNRIADGIASSDGRYPVWDYKSLLELINTLEEEYKKNDGASARSRLQQTCNNLATDCISRAAAIDAVCKLMNSWFGGDSSKDEREEITWIINHLPSAQQWIPCSERLPDEGNEVLVCYDYKGHRSVLIGTLYSDGKFYGYDDEYLTSEGRKYRKVVAWMPLPEPYRGEKNENR